MTEVRIRNWNELNEEVFRESWYAPHRWSRGPFVFRGMSNARWDLRTSLMRLGGPYHQIESSLLRNFRKYGHRNSGSGESFWHWLAVAQHHGLPTRLLHWTYSPHVAAHFATEDMEELAHNGAIWRVDIMRVHQRLPKELRQMLEEENAVVFTTNMLDSYATSLAEFDRRLSSVEGGAVLFLEPPSLDDRIVNQAAFLSIMSPATARLDHWLERIAPDPFRKIVIPASVKLEVRDKLDMMNLTERMIYPGLDGLSKWLKRYYSPLNLMEIRYPEDVMGPNSKRLALIAGADSGVLTVALLAENAEVECSSRVESRADGCWYDIERNCRIEVRLRAGSAADK